MCLYTLRISGVDTTTPIDPTLGATKNVTGVNNADVLGFETAVNDSLAFCIASFDGGDGDPFTTASSGWTMIASQDSGSSASSVASVGYANKDMATAGATGTCNVASSGQADGWSAYQFAIAPGAGGENTSILVPTGPWR